MSPRTKPLQKDYLSDPEQECLRYLREKWESEHSRNKQNFKVDDHLLLRFAAASNFDRRRAWKKLKKVNLIYLSVTPTRSLRKQIKTKVSLSPFSLKAHRRHITF